MTNSYALLNVITSPSPSSFLQTLRDLDFSRLTIQTGTSDLRLLHQILGEGEADSTDAHLINYGTHYGVTINSFTFKASIEADIVNSHLIIGHAGAGTTLEVLRAKKRFIAVVNPSLMDNHQLELAHELSRHGYLSHCYPGDLMHTLRKVYQDNSLKSFPSFNPNLFSNFVDQVIKQNLLEK